MKRVFSVFLILLMLTGASFAHSGKTDSKGGHQNHSTGEYHYHHGYSAHQHTGGMCPYDFDVKTSHSSGVSAAKKNNDIAIQQKPKVKSISDIAAFVFAIIAAIIGSFFIVIPILLSLIYKIVESLKKVCLWIWERIK